MKIKYIISVIVLFIIVQTLSAQVSTSVLQTDSQSKISEQFKEPDMLFAPYAFWFWDEPLYDSIYPQKPADMAAKMLEQGLNPGYVHPRISMYDLLQKPEQMHPAPSLPKEQWLSDKWFDAYGAAVKATNEGGGYIGFVDEYMWPMGRAAGKVMKANPELAQQHVQWEIFDVKGGEPIDLPKSFYTIAARIDSLRLLPTIIDKPIFELRQVKDVNVDCDKSIGQSVTVEEERLKSISVRLTCWKSIIQKGSFKMTIQLDSPDGRLVEEMSYKGVIKDGLVPTIDLKEEFKIGTKLYIELSIGKDYPEGGAAWWSKEEDVYAGGMAYTDGLPSKGDRFTTMHYESDPENLEMIVKRANIFSESLRIIGQDSAFKWSAPGNNEEMWRIYSFKKVTGGDVNVLDNRLADAYISQVHQPHYDHFGDKMGTTISGVFCDTEGSYGNGGGFVWSDDLDKKYTSNTGNDIRYALPLLLDEDVEGKYGKARFDWFDAVSDQYAGFYNQVSNWLGKHNMYYIANVWEESLQWQSSCVSDHMKVQRAFSMPGTDCLGLRAYDVHDFKESQSVAEFEGRRLQSEIMGAGGWPTFTMKTIKECANCVLAWGVNHVVPHGIFMTRSLEGNVWVPDWFDENPVWNNLHIWTDFVRRASYINSQGHVNPDVMLYNPMSSVWALLGETESLFWGPKAGNILVLDKTYSKKVQLINDVYSDAIRTLTENRIEYLITDRTYVESCQLNGQSLTTDKFTFKTIVLPPMVIMPLDVAKKMVDFAKKGGHIFALGELPNGSTDNGFNDPKMLALMNKLRACKSFREVENLEESLKQKPTGLKSPVQFIEGEFPMLQLRRKIDGCDYFWLVNNNEEQQECVVSLKGVKGGAAIFDCETGERKAIASSNGTLQLTFKPHEAYWLVFDPNTPELSEPVMSFPKTQLVATLNNWKVSLDQSKQPNLESPCVIEKLMLGGNSVKKSLTDWSTWDEIPDNFSGLIDYETSIVLSEVKNPMVLDLGMVNHFAEVWVNDIFIGAKLWGSYEFTSDAFVEGINKIKIRVGNLSNKSYDMDSPSGLFGPVSIKEVDL